MRLSRSQYLGRFASPAGPRFDVGMPEPPADARWVIATISKVFANYEAADEWFEKNDPEGY